MVTTAAVPSLTALVAALLAAVSLSPRPAVAAVPTYDRSAVLAAVDAAFDRARGDGLGGRLLDALPGAVPRAVPSASPASGERAWASDGYCHQAEHADPDDVAWLDVASYGAFLDCASGVWVFPAVTFDAWSTSRLDSWAVVLDTDNLPSTGCGGYELLAIAVYDSATASLVAGLLDTPSCDDATWSVRADLYADRTSSTDVYLAVAHSSLGSPALVRWWTWLAPVDGDWFDVAPDTGDHVEDVSGVDPCAPAAAAASATPAVEDLYVATPTTAPGGLAMATTARAALAGSNAVRDVVSLGHGVVRFTAAPEAARRALATAGVALDVHVDHPRAWAQAPDDPLYPGQWELADVDAAGAWTHTTGASSVVVAVLDSGVDRDHGELAGQLTGGYDATTGTALAAGNTDSVGHGTAVTGMVVAATDNSAGVASLGRETSVLPVKVGEEGVSSSALVAGIRHAVDAGADVINLSLGGFCASTPEADAIAHARAAGILVVAAAGNAQLEGNPAVYPASYEGVVGVGATTRQRQIASYSSTGAFVDVTAPGGEPGSGVTVLLPGGGTGEMSGTSFSAPMVSAAAALALALDPALTERQLAALVTATAHDLGPAGRDDTFGHGLLRAGAGLHALSITERHHGADRYATAAAVATAGWPAGAGLVYLATGKAFPDALVAGALAGRSPGPLLLTAPCSLPAATATALDQLGPSTVVVIGGEDAVCPAVAADVATRTGATVERVAGASRYETAAALSRRGWAAATTVFVASGAGFPDGLTGAARAARADAPLVLAQPCALPAPTADELSRLAPSEVVVIGGPAAVCDDVLTAIAARTGASVRRLAGADRYATAAAVVDDGWPATHPLLYVATGANFPDGLAVGPLAALDGAPLLLVKTCAVPAAIADAVARLDPDGVEVIGGTSAVCDGAAWAAASHAW